MNKEKHKLKVAIKKAFYTKLLTSNMIKLIGFLRIIKDIQYRIKLLSKSEKYGKKKENKVLIL